MNNKKGAVLLINPPIYDFAAFDFWSKPLGILYLSSILKQNGFSVKMFDYMYRHFGSIESKSDEYGCGHYNKVRVQKPQVYKDIVRYYSRYGLSREIAENYFEELSLSKNDFPELILVTSVMTYWYPGVF